MMKDLFTTVFYDFLIQYLILDIVICAPLNVWFDPWGAVMWVHVPTDYYYYFYKTSHLYFDMTWRTWHDRDWLGRIQKNVGCPDRDFTLFDDEYWKFINKPWNEEYRWQLFLTNWGGLIFSGAKVIYPRIWQLMDAYASIFEVVYQDDVKAYPYSVVEYVYPKPLYNLSDLEAREIKVGFYLDNLETQMIVSPKKFKTVGDDFHEVYGERFSVQNRLKLIEHYNNPYGLLDPVKSKSQTANNDFRDKDFNYPKPVNFVDMRMDFYRLGRKWKDFGMEIWKTYSDY